MPTKKVKPVPKSNVESMIKEHQHEAKKRLEDLKAWMEKLEKAINDPEMETRGVGVLWVNFAEEHINSIRHHVTSIDALAKVQVWN